MDDRNPELEEEEASSYDRTASTVQQQLQQQQLCRDAEGNIICYDTEKAVILAKVQADGSTLQDVPKVFQADKDVVLAACRQSGRAFIHASVELQKDDKDVALTACRQKGKILEVMKELQWQADRDIVLAACQQHGGALMHASKELKSNKAIVLVACRQNGYALEHASSELKQDKQVVLVACRQNGGALMHAKKELKADQEVVVAACQEDGEALGDASDDLKANKDVVLVACHQDGLALTFASDKLKDDRDVVLTACRQNGYALRFASDKLRADELVVTTAVASNPNALKFAAGGLSQRKECLVAAKVWDGSYDSEQAAKMQGSDSCVGPKIVLSTRFALRPNSESQATIFPVLLKKNDYIQQQNFCIYSPNAFAKDTCDPEWTRYSWPCRGTFDTCQKPDSLKIGDPQPGSCWRLSFRYQLEKAKETNGCMIQLVEREERYSKNQSVGNGQKIEAEMANDIGTKVFRVHAPEWRIDLDRPFTAEHIQLVVSKLRGWYESGCTDVSACVLAFDKDIRNSTPHLLKTDELRERGLVDI